MTPNAEFIAIVEGLEYGVRTLADTVEVEVVITRVGSTDALDVERFPDRASAVAFIHNRANKVSLVPISEGRYAVSRENSGNPAAKKPQGRG